MAAAGWHAHITRFPDAANPNHLATFDFTPMPYVSYRDQLRAQAIWRRYTDRLPFSAVTDWTALEPIVAGSGNTAHLEVLPERLRPQLIKAAEIAESLRLYNAVYHDELLGGRGRSSLRKASLTVLSSQRLKAGEFESGESSPSSVGLSVARKFLKTMPKFC